MPEYPVDYSAWTNERLIERVTALERQLEEQNARLVILKPEATRSQADLYLTRYHIQTTEDRPKNARVNRVFDLSNYSTRFIALKFAYLGQRYNGFEHHKNNTTPLPTIEEELWKALTKARLLFPSDKDEAKTGEINWEGCDYSKCGRTDKGVSAFGQVMGIRVRSNGPIFRRPCAKQNRNGEDVSTFSNPEPETKHVPTLSTQESSNESTTFHHLDDEIPYIQVLNRLLPSDIRILAWCPSPPQDFSARFSCKERRYRYFFTQPAFNPTHGSAGFVDNIASTSCDGRQRREGWLDIDAMRVGALKFVGLHDFRNFCKLDASKQIENFERRIFHADIEEMHSDSPSSNYISSPGFREFEDVIADPDEHGLKSSAPTPKLYYFAVNGSAFLWHQVRHMVAILFLIGQGLEPPSVIDELLDVGKNPGKPIYEMADDAPLVLWDCIFPDQSSGNREDALEWVYAGETAGKENGVIARNNGKFGMGGVVDGTWKLWRQCKIDEILAGSLLDIIVQQGGYASLVSNSQKVVNGFKGKPPSQKIFAGGNAPQLKGKYTPLLKRPRMETVQVINARFAAKKRINVREEDVDE